ncbi:hypothetical protein [Kribbella sp. DT2]|uniref:hypothetical protein n=1 Tax=Kribbella sp. DT2 TaxID=3393427 RepID=UPI003CFACC3D
MTGVADCGQPDDFGACDGIFLCAEPPELDDLVLDTCYLSMLARGATAWVEDQRPGKAAEFLGRVLSAHRCGGRRLLVAQSQFDREIKDSGGRPFEYAELPAYFFADHLEPIAGGLPEQYFSVGIEREKQFLEARRDDRLGQARIEHQQLSDQSAAYRRAVTGFRRQARSLVLAETVDEVVSDLTTRGADPLVRLIKSHWKQLPDGSAFDLAADGSIQAIHGSRPVDYSSMSGGEKARALLVYRIAALKALSNSPLLMLDEPLEHLDPRNRWKLARMLSDLTAQKVLRQVLITTYEESLARKLALRNSRMDGEPVRVLLVDGKGGIEA